MQTGTPEDIVLRPADDYVAEFVQHMNPLTVLKGSNVMRAADDLAWDGRSAWLDEERRCQVTLDAAGRPVAARVDGVACAVSSRDGPASASGAMAGEIVAASALLPLRAIIQLRQASGLPVLLLDQGRFCGVCSEGDILRALAGVERRSAPAPKPVAVTAA